MHNIFDEQKPAEYHPDYPGCLRLWSGVLETAWHDALGHHLYDEHRTAIMANARRWFFSDAEDVCSFLWICTILGIDEQGIREQLAARLKEQ